jgi:hypothetical protein
MFCSYEVTFGVVTAEVSLARQTPAVFRLSTTSSYWMKNQSPPETTLFAVQLGKSQARWPARDLSELFVLEATLEARSQIKIGFKALK